MDDKSITMCVATIFLKIWADVTTNDVAMFVAIGAGLTTIVYNIYKIVKEVKG